MKKSKFIMTCCILLALVPFQSCNNEAAIKAAQDAANSRVTAVTDSLQGAWKADVDAVKASCGAQVQSLQDSLTSVNAKLAATATKKPASKTTTTTKPKTEPGKINVGKKGGQ